MDCGLRWLVTNPVTSTIAYPQSNPSLETTQRDLIATVSVEAASVLEILSLTGDRNFRQQVLDETKKMLILYLKQYFPD